MDDTERRASFTGENALMRPPEQSGLPVPNDEQARLGQAALQRDRVALIALKEAFATHALPYDLSESATPWLDWDAISTSGKKGGGGGGGGGGTPPVTPQHYAASWNWFMGDVMYMDTAVSGGFPNPFGHIAIVDREVNQVIPAAIDSHPDNPGRAVFRYSNIDDLASKYYYVQGNRMNLQYQQSNFGGNYGVNWSPPSWIRFMAVINARSWVGTTTYSVFTQKEVAPTTYCSLMIWAAYKEAARQSRSLPWFMNHPYGVYPSLDIDLDSDGGFIVTPADILRSSWVSFVIGSSRKFASGGGGGGGGCEHCHPYRGVLDLVWPIGNVATTNNVTHN